MISEDRLLDEARSFLDDNAECRRPDAFEWGLGSDRVALFEERTPEEHAAWLADARGWKATEFDAGFGWLTGPEEHGGRALTPAHELAYRSLRAEYAIPSLQCFAVGIGIVAPTILVHGSPAARARFLRAMHRGDVIACQLFSEPGAGSDLAAVQSRAERDGEKWRVTGHKVWTSGAQHSQLGLILTRTSRGESRHAGLTMFLVDLAETGVSVRPLRQMTGGAAFNEVLLEAVSIPDTYRLGAVDDGWTVALTTLMHERVAIGAGMDDGLRSFDRLRALARHMELHGDPVVRQALADLYVHLHAARYTNLRALEAAAAGGIPGPELSVAKLLFSQNQERIARVAALLLGPRLAADTGEWGTYAWSRFVTSVPGVRIAGGTDDILRTVIGERVLGLPKEPRPAG